MSRVLEVHMFRRLVWVPICLASCTFTVDPPPARNCAVRTPFYPDADGDGLGEPTATYVGCTAPEGWVTELADSGDPGDTSDTADTGLEEDTDSGD